jgi:hypothetical protein
MNVLTRALGWLLPRSWIFVIAFAALAAGVAYIVVGQLPPVPDAVVRFDADRPAALLDDGRVMTATPSGRAWRGPVSIKNNAGRIERSILADRLIAGVSVNPFTGEIAVVEANPARLHRWNLSSEPTSIELPAPFPVETANVAWSRNGAMAVDVRGVEKRNNAMLISPRGEIRELPEAAAPFAFSDDGALLASVDAGSITDEVPKIEKVAKAHHVLVWDLKRAGEPRTFAGFDGKPLHLEFSPSADKLAYFGRWQMPGWTKESPDAESWDVATGKELGIFGPVVALPTDDMRVIWFVGQAQANEMGMVNKLTWQKHDDKTFRVSTPKYWAPDRSDIYMHLVRTPNTAYFLGDGYSQAPTALLWRLRLPQSVIDFIQKYTGGAKRRGVVANVFDVWTADRLAEVHVPSKDWSLMSSPSGYTIALASPDHTEYRVYRLPHQPRWWTAVGVGLAVAFAFVTLLRFLWLLLNTTFTRILRRTDPQPTVLSK